MGVILESVLWCIQGVLDFYLALIIINVGIYWATHFNIIGQGGATFKKFVEILNQLSEPVYAKIRDKIKPIAGIDFSAYILIAILMVIVHLLQNIRIELMN